MHDSSENELANKADLNEFLFRAWLLKSGERAVCMRLSGGVSSDIWHIDLPNKTLCVKRALANLKVTAKWSAPTERNNFEWKWFKFVHQNFPQIVPQPIAHDDEMQMLAMEFLPPDEFPVWKALLLQGIADTAFASQAGRLLGQIHAKSAFNDEIARTFATDEIFFALRIEPYLLATAAKHPALASKIESVAKKTLATKIALVHGDVSPKNILVGKNNPIFLDAETAWFGDPAFDLAFCLNHFLLKCAFCPSATKEFIACFNLFAENYLNQVDWEKREEIEARTTHLLAILYLARVDGKSPVEYISNENTKNRIRQTANSLISNPAHQLIEFICRWNKL